MGSGLLSSAGTPIRVRHRGPAILLGVAAPVLLAFAMLLHGPTVAVGIASRLSPAVVFSAEVEERVVALTIDDGPSAATDEILRVLSEHDAHSTFFLIGRHAARRPATIERIRAQGHELAHHMMADEPSIRLDRDTFLAQFGQMDRLLDQLDGARWFRPGSGWYGPTMLADVERSGYRLVLGSVYPFDAQIPSPDFMAWYILEKVRPGSIIVLHDGADRAARTAAALARVIPELRRRGYRIVTVTDLLRFEGTDRYAERPSISSVSD